MALSLERLCVDADRRYKIRLIAGRQGIQNIVKWVHIIDDERGADFINGNELIFATGVANLKEEETLVSFILAIINKGAAGLVINVGKYIEKISNRVVDLCNEKSFPLYLCPWEIKLSEVTKYLCEKILDSERKNNSFTGIIKDFIFYPKTRSDLSFELERKGFEKNHIYQVISIGYGMDEGGDNHNRNDYLENIIARELEKLLMGKYILFWHHNILSIIIKNGDDTVEMFINEMSIRNDSRKKYYIAVSDKKSDYNNIPLLYEQSMKVFSLCEKECKTLLYYTNLGLYKLLLSIEDINILKTFADDTVGKIKEYDANNETGLLEFLKVFIENNGSIQQTAEVLYVHRNTINYKVSKIKKITGMNVTDLDNLLLIKLAFNIEAMI